MVHLLRRYQFLSRTNLSAINYLVEAANKSPEFLIRESSNQGCYTFRVGLPSEVCDMSLLTRLLGCALEFMVLCGESVALRWLLLQQWILSGGWWWWNYRCAGID